MSLNHSDYHILFLGSGPFALEKRPGKDKLTYFSKHAFCTFLTPVNQATLEKTGLKPVNVSENLRLIPFVYESENPFKRNLLSFYHIISKALMLNDQKTDPYSVVISNNPMITGLCAVIVSKLTGAKSIIEVNGDFKFSFTYDLNQNSLLALLKKSVGKRLMKFVLKNADGIRLLYPGQLDFLFNETDRSLLTIADFAEFTYIEPFLRRKKQDKKYLLLVGYPWHLKGVDILIKSFLKISDKFPEFRLKIVGWCPQGFEYYQSLTKGNDRIDLCKPVPHKDVINLFCNCSVYVLASRTEAMGRVLLEAMASQKPIVASDVGGVSRVIIDGYNGLLFQSENVDDLAMKLQKLLSDKRFARTLAQNGSEYVKDKLSENNYIRNYMDFINLINKKI